LPRLLSRSARAVDYFNRAGGASQNRSVLRRNEPSARQREFPPRAETFYDVRMPAASLTISPLKTFFSLTRNRFWPLQIGGWLCYMTMSFSAKVGEGAPWSWIFFYLAVAVSGVVVTSALRLGYRTIWHWPAPRMAAAAGGFLLLATLVQMRIFVALLSGFCDDCEMHSVFGYLWYFASMFYLLLSWSGLYFGIKFSRLLQAQKEAALKAQAMAHEAQLKMLRYQLNPHFLFNTLNAISTLVLDGRSTTANAMVGSLSSFLRYSLDSDPVQRVTLAQEIEATNLYLGIEQLRFAERLRVRIDVAGDATAALVPSLILQPLIENAVKYAVSRSEEGGTIDISARHVANYLEIIVYDDGPGCHDVTDCPNGHGVGLRNTRERLRVLYGVEHDFNVVNRLPHGLEIRIRIPYENAELSKLAEVYA
jgi:two-component system, LytTR family, sensor kinase